MTKHVVYFLLEFIVTGGWSQSRLSLGEKNYNIPYYHHFVSI